MPGSYSPSGKVMPQIDHQPAARIRRADSRRDRRSCRSRRGRRAPRTRARRRRTAAGTPLLLAHAPLSFAANVTSPKEKRELAPVGVVDQQRAVVVEAGEAAGDQAARGVDGQRLADRRRRGRAMPRARAQSPRRSPRFRSSRSWSAPGSTTPRAAKALIRAAREMSRPLPKSSGAETRLRPTPMTATVPRVRGPRGAFNQNAARLRRADENVVGPLEAQAGNALPRGGSHRWRRRRRRARAGRPWRADTSSVVTQAGEEVARLARPRRGPSGRARPSAGRR